MAIFAISLISCSDKPSNSGEKEKEGTETKSSKDKLSDDESSTDLIDATTLDDEEEIADNEDADIEEDGDIDEDNADNDDDSANNSKTSSSSTDYDDLLDSYEKYVDKYIALLKKVKAGDTSAMNEYPEMLEEAQNLSEKIKNATGELTSSQIAKYQRISNKMLKAAQELQ